MRARFPALMPALLLAFALAWPGALRAEPVSVRAAPHDGFGRVVFNWQTPVPYSTSTAGNQVTVRFGRAIETADLPSAVRALSKYLSAARVGADGRSVVLTLTAPHAVNAYDLGEAVVVDIRDQPAAAAPAAPPAPAEASTAAPQSAPAQPAAPQPAAAPAPAEAAAAPALGVRTGEHQDFSRVVFDWPSNVGYSVDRSGGTVTLTFDRPANARLGPVRARLPKNLQGIDAAVSGGKLTVTLRIPETSEIKHFRSGPKVVVDISAPRPGAATPAPAPQPTPTPAAKPAPAAEAAKPAAEAAKPAAGTAAAPAAKPAAPSTPADVSPDLLAAAEAAAQALASASQEGPISGKPTPLMPVKPTVLTPPVAASQAPAAAASRAPAGGPGPGEAPAPSGPINGVSMRFDWTEQVAAAIFRRAGYLWVVFDKQKKIDTQLLYATTGNVVRNIEQIPNDQGTVLRMDTVSGVNPTPRRDPPAWILDFQKQPLVPQTAISANAQTDSPAGARVFLPVPEPGKAVAVRDPEVGDTVVVVPVIPLGHGIGTEHDYPQFRILPSSQGVVIQPTVDTLRVRPLRQGIELTSSDPMQISPVTAAAAATTQFAGAGPLTHVLDLERWRGADPSAFVEQEQRLLGAAARASGDGARERARLNLARFYVSNGYGAEALGVLEVMGRARQGIQEEPEYRALTAVADFLMGRYKESEDNWYHPSLNNNDEATFWRAALAARRGDSVRAARVLRRTGGVMRAYPKALKMPLGILVANAALDVGDVLQASHTVDVLKVAEPNPSETAQIGLVEGRLLEKSGDFDGAISKYEDVQAGPDRKSAAAATVARTELLLKLKKITPAEAIDAYEGLRFVWRGDEFEFKLLRRLGSLYLETGDYRNGLRTLKQAATHFRDDPKVPEVTQQMADAFKHLYLEGGADSLPPVSAIALYEEFKELTPAGAEGDEMIRKLADRLVGVDLLDRGASLLDQQVEFRLQGAEKARVGARLALIRILANEPEKAVAALDASAANGLPADLADQRRRLRARATVQLGKPEDALKMLENDESPDADRIRADIYWAAQDWANAAQVIGRLVRADGITPKTRLTDKQALGVLRMVIAMTLAGNDRGVARAQVDYARAMDATPYRDAFRLIASPETAGASFATLTGKVKDAENFQSFLEAYRDQLKNKKLSELFSSDMPSITG